MNQLFYGDNLEVLSRYIPAESVDLVYLDPPFNSRLICDAVHQSRIQIAIKWKAERL